MENSLSAVVESCSTIDTTNELCAIGCFTGSVTVYSISKEPEWLQRKWSKTHKGPVRRVRFTKDSSSVYTITANKALCRWDVETSKKARCIRKAHTCAPYSICTSNGGLIFTGDESGNVRTWDFRCDEPLVWELDEIADYVTDLALADPEERTLLATAGDCTLSAFDVRKRSLLVQSEEMHSELQSLAVLPLLGKVVCGAEDGYFEIFNLGEFGNIIDRIESKHTDTIDCVRPTNERLLVSASADGTIRLSSIEPNRASFAILGRHTDAVLEIAVTSDERYVLSCGLDARVHAWDLGRVIDERDADLMRASGTTKRKADGKGAAFFTDLL